VDEASSLLPGLGEERASMFDTAASCDDLRLEEAVPCAAMVATDMMARWLDWGRRPIRYAVC